MLHLLSYADKELTNSLLLASDWFTNISVCDLVLQKEIQRKKSQSDPKNSSPITNPCLCPTKTTSNMPMHTIIYIYHPSPKS